MGASAGAPGEASTLGATSSAIRTLKNVVGSIRDVPGSIAFLKSCRVPSGGFSQKPGGPPEVLTTATGLMAVAEMKIADKETIDGAIAFFHDNVKTFEEIRIAVAGLEAVSATSADFAKWTEIVNSDRNPDGTWGEGPGKARATGSAAVALLRMGVSLDKKEAILAALRAAQQADGAWSKDGGPADLEPTYRIMRLFYMLKEAPHLASLRSFLDKCRQPDGSYSTAPGKPGTSGGTYLATTVLKWSRLLDGEPAVIETAGFQPLFDGKTLDGWEGDTALWSARDGMIVGKSSGLDHNDFLATKADYGDFILQFSFRMLGSEESNSGMQFRSARVPGHEMSGYQADIGQGYWGSLYDESRRNKILAQASEKVLAEVHKGAWNHYVVRAMGGHITMSLNGVTSVDYREDDPEIAREGKLAVQIHAGGPMEIQFKDLYIQPLPRPMPAVAADHFRLRTLKSPDGERKYSIFVPTSYDSSKPVPAVLFLHGSGERGNDGISQAQVGLGAILAQHPEDFPGIAVFPQARTTWAPGSDDIKAALLALDDVMASYKVDPDRVALTGISMGGSGSWGLAASDPQRFSAVAPVCGRGKPADAALMKDLPTWAVVGDADGAGTVLNGREMIAALRAANNPARLTEYRGVGHNSWDRAYSDRELLDWLVTQTRKPRL